MGNSLNSSKQRDDSPEECENDTCQIRRTVRMLDLAAARVSYALHDGNDSVDTLVGSFTNMTEQVMTMKQSIQTLPESELKTNLLENCQQALKTVQETTIAFQFYDRLSQRMQHISTSLDELSQIIDSPEKMHEPSEWLSLEDKIRSHYTLDSDLKMFEAVLAGENINELMSKATKAVDDSGDIELF